MSKPKNRVRVSFKSSGAAEDVTGSCAVITWGKPERTILVDCGLIQGGQSLLKEYQANKARFTFKEKNVEYVFVTHSHADHSCRVPLLTKRGFEGVIVVPEGNKEIIRELQLDCAKILSRNAEDLTYRFKDKEFLPIYDEKDVKRTYSKIKECPFNQKIVLDDEISFEWIPAGHIINSAQLILYIKCGNSIKKIAFTGDLGNLKTQNYYENKFTPIQNANLLVGECTYADKKRTLKGKEREKDLEKIRSIVQDVCVDGKGSLLFPSFSLMRSQTILTVLCDMYKDDETFTYPVYVASPLTCKISDIFSDVLQGEQLEKWEEAKNWDRVQFIKDFDTLAEIVSEGKPAIYLASAGMMNAGYSVYLAEQLLPHSKNGIVFIGYSVEGTLAWKIKQKKQKTVTVNGHQVASRCRVINLASFSSHMQRDDLCKYYSGGFGTGGYEKIVLQHGNMKDRVELAKDIQELISSRNRTDKVVVGNKSLEILV